MHALLPDKVVVKDAATGADRTAVDFGDIIFKRGTAVNTTMKLGDLFTSLGMGHAGTCVLTVDAHDTVDSHTAYMLCLCFMLAVKLWCTI
jgi:hypothetical protein